MTIFICSRRILRATNILFVTCFGMLGISTACRAAEAVPAVTGGAQVDYNSKYIWRGIALSTWIGVGPAVSVDKQRQRHTQYLGKTRR